MKLKVQLTSSPGSQSPEEAHMGPLCNLGGRRLFFVHSRNKLRVLKKKKKKKDLLTS